MFEMFGKFILIQNI